MQLDTSPLGLFIKLLKKGVTFLGKLRLMVIVIYYDSLFSSKKPNKIDIAE